MPGQLPKCFFTDIDQFIETLLAGAGTASGFFGIVTVSTPFSSFADIFSASAVSGSSNALLNAALPKLLPVFSTAVVFSSLLFPDQMVRILSYVSI